MSSGRPIFLWKTIQLFKSGTAWALALLVISGIPASAATIKGVQTGTARSTGNGYITAAIPNAIDTTKSFLVFTLRHNLNRPVINVAGRIKDANTVEFYRATNEGSTVDIAWSVVEFSSGVTVRRDTTTLNVTIRDSALVPALSYDSQSFVILGHTVLTGDGLWSNDDPVVGRLLDKNTVRMHSDNSNGGHQLWWEVVEFTELGQAYVQTELGVMTNAETATNITLDNAVDTSRAFVIVTWRMNPSVTRVSNFAMSAEFTSTTNVQVIRNRATDAVTEIAVQVVELLDGSRVQHGKQILNQGTANASIAINPVNLNRATAFSGVNASGAGLGGGRTYHDIDDILGVQACTFVLSNATTLNIRRSNTDSEATFPWQVIEFAAHDSEPNIWYVNDATYDANDSFTTERGYDTASGLTRDRPFLRIDSAMAKAGAGDTIYIDAGTFSDTIHIKDSGVFIIGVDSTLTIIDHNDSTTTGNAGVRVTGGVAFVTVSDLQIVDAYYGVWFESVDTGRIERVRVLQSGNNGLLIAKGSDSNTLVRNEVLKAGGSGIRVESDSNVILYNRAAFAPGNNGFNLSATDDASYNILIGNRADSNGTTGFFIGEDFNSLQGNIAYMNTTHGFSFGNQTGSNIQIGDTATLNGENGWKINATTTQNIFRQNVSETNSEDGFNFNDADNQLFDTNLAYGNLRHGFNLGDDAGADGANNNTLRWNVVNDNGGNGFSIDTGSSSASLDSNSAARNGGHGFFVDNDAGNNNMLMGNTALENIGDGYLVLTNGNHLFGSVARRNAGVGFNFNTTSDNNSVIGNIAVENAGDGFNLDAANNNIVSQNTADSNGGWGFDVLNLSTGNTFLKNNIITGTIRPDSGVRNNLIATNVNFSRSYWGTTDSGLISGRFRNSGVGASLTFYPFRLSIVDSAISGDSVAPNSPDTVTATQTGSETIVIKWARSAGSEETEADTDLGGYRIYRSQRPDTTQWLLIGDGNLTTQSFTDSGLTQDTDYYYRVTAFDTHAPHFNESFFSDSIAGDTPIQDTSGPNAWYVNDGTYDASDSFTFAVGNDQNVGYTAAAPFLTLTQAVSRLTLGDTIYIDAGTFTDTLQISVSGVFIIGVDSALSVIDGTDSTDEVNTGVHIFGGAQYVTIKNLQIKRTWTGIHLDAADSCTISSVKMRDNNYRGLVVGNGAESNVVEFSEMLDAIAGLELQGDSNRFLNSRFADAQLPGVFINTTGDWNLFQNCVSESNTTFGFENKGNSNFFNSNRASNNGSDGFKAVTNTALRGRYLNNLSETNGIDGFYSVNGDNHSFESNVAYGNSGDGFNAASSSDGNTWINNTSSSNGATGFFIEGNGDTLLRNTSRRNTTSGINVTGNNVLLSENTVEYNTLRGFHIQTATGCTLTYNLSRENNGTEPLGIGYDIVASPNTVLYQNTADSNLHWGFAFTNNATTVTFRKNNIITGTVFFDSGVINTTANTYDVSQNYWNTIDSAFIRSKLSSTGGGNLTFDSYRLGAVDTTPGSDSTAPNAPDTVTASKSGAETIIIKWAKTSGSESAESDTDLANYRIYRSQKSDTSLWILIGDGDSTTQIFTDSGLTSDTGYYYRVTAFDTHFPHFNESFFSDSIAGDTTPIDTSGANAWYVNDGTHNASDSFTFAVGNDANVGYKTTAPFLTLKRAMSRVSMGDTVFIDAGTFAETITIDTNGVFIIGVDSTLTVLDSNDSTSTWNFGIHVTGTRQYVTIEDLQIIDAYNGIELNALDSGLVQRVKIVQSGNYGLAIQDGSDSNRILNNEVIRSDVHNFWIAGDSNILTGNRSALNLTGGGFKAAFSPSGQWNVFTNNISESTVSGYGFVIEDDPNTLIGNRASNNASGGFFSGANSSGLIFRSNTAETNTGDGFHLNDADNGIYDTNVSYGNTNDGFDITDDAGATGSDNNTFRWNSANNNGQDGFRVSEGSDGDTFLANSVSRSGGAGFQFMNSAGNVHWILENTSFENASAGFIFNTNNNIIERNTSHGARGGNAGLFWDNTSDGNRIIGNVSYNNTGVGFGFSASNNNFIAQNTSESNVKAALRFTVNAGAAQTLNKNNMTGFLGNSDSLVWNENANTYDLSRSHFGATDSDVISSGMLITGVGAVTYTPWRLGAVDTGQNADTVAPNAPDTVTANQAGAETIVVKWAKAAGSEETEADTALAGYRVYRSQKSDTSYWVLIGDGDSTTQTFTDSALTTDTGYYYRVTAFDTNPFFVNESFFSDSIAGDTPLQDTSGANIWYVNDGTYDANDSFTFAVGNDANVGYSSALPFLTISKAVAQLTPGDTIYVDAGTFGETITINVSQVFVIGVDSALTIIDGGDSLGGTNYGIYVTGNDTNLTIRDLQVTNARDGIHFDDGDTIALERIRFRKNGNAGINITTGSDFITISACVSETNVSHGVLVSGNNSAISITKSRGNGGDGFRFDGGATRSVVTGNTSSKNTNSGFHVPNAGGNNNNFDSNLALENTGDGFLILTNGNHLFGDVARRNTGAGFNFNTTSDNNSVIGTVANENGGAGYNLDAADNNIFAQNTADSNGGWGFDISNLSAGNVFIKNNILTGAIRPDSGVRNDLLATNVNFSRSYWGTTDSGLISGRFRNSGIGATLTYYPFRLSIIDSAVSGDTVAPGAPDTVTATAGGAETIVIKWARTSGSEETEGDTDLGGYRIYRSQRSDTTQWILIGDGDIATQAFTDSSLTRDTGYYYRVTAFDTHTPNSNEAFFSDSLAVDTPLFDTSGSNAWYVNDATYDASDSFTFATGNDQNVGYLPTSPFLTLDEAERRLTAGDTIYIDAGTFTDTLTIETDAVFIIGVDSTLTIISPGDSTVVLDTGIQVVSARNVQIRTLQIKSAFSGIAISGSDSTRITSVKTIDISNRGIDIYYGSDSNIIENSEFLDGSVAVEIEGDSNQLLYSRLAFATLPGLHMMPDAESNLVKGCVAESNTTFGFQNKGSYNIFENNRASNNGSDGFILGLPTTAMRFNVYTNNTAETNGRDGFHISDGDDNIFDTNISYGNTEDGFEITDNAGADGADNNRFRWNTVSNNGQDGFRVNEGSDGDTFLANSVSRSGGAGFQLMNSAGNVHWILENTSFENANAGFIIYTNNNIIERNTAYGARGGNSGLFWDNTSDGNRIIGNVSYNNTGAGFAFSASNNNFFAQNTSESNVKAALRFAVNAGAAQTLGKNNMTGFLGSSDSLVWNENANTYDLSRSHFGATDSVSISAGMLNTGGGAVTYTPWRLGTVDTGQNADTVAPIAPDTVAAARQSAFSIKVTWARTSGSEETEADTDLAGYRIYRSQNPETSQWILAGDGEPTTQSFTDSGLAEDTGYYYRVTAFDTNQFFFNESFFSDSIAGDTTALDTSGANSWYVNDGTYDANDSFTFAVGNDANLGYQPSSPFLTLAQAERYLTAGDTIFIDAGTFNDTLTIDTNSVFILGVDSSLTILDSNDSTTTTNYGILVSDTVQSANIRDLMVRDAYHGIRFEGGDSGTVERVSVIQAGQHGFSLSNGSESNLITHSYAERNGEVGYHINGDTNMIAHSAARQNVQHGFRLKAEAQQNIFRQNTAETNGTDGFHLNDADNNTFDTNLSYGNTGDGFDITDDVGVTGADNNTFRWNSSNENGIYGFQITNGSGENTFLGNTASANTSIGFFILDAGGDANVLLENISKDNGSHNYAIQTNNNILERNTAIKSGNSTDGFIFNSTANSNRIIGNYAFNNARSGFDISGSNSNFIAQNTAESNTATGFWFTTLAGASQTILKNNIIGTLGNPDSLILNWGANTYDFDTTYFGTTDSSAIAAGILNTGGGAIIFTPWRLGFVDTGPNADTVAPGAPDTVSVGRNTFGSLRITWARTTASEETEPDTDLAGYRVYRSQNRDTSQWILIGDGDSTTQSFVDSGLANDTIYYYRVTAFDTNSFFFNESFFSDSIIGDTTLRDTSGANAWYVNDGTYDANDSFTFAVGNDQNLGYDPASPFLTIDEAERFLTEGDTLYIDAGTFTDTLSISDSGIFIIGVDSSLTIIDPNDSSSPRNHGITTSGTFKVLTIRNLQIADARTGVLVKNVDSVTIDRIRVNRPGDSGIQLGEGSDSGSVTNNEILRAGGAGIVVNNDSSEITGNRIANSATWGILINFSAAFTPQNNIVRDNRVETAGGIGIQFGNGPCTATGNTIFNSGSWGLIVGIKASSSYFAENTIGTGATAGFLLNDADNCVVDTNFVYGNAGPGFDIGDQSGSDGADNNLLRWNVANNNSGTGYSVDSGSNNVTLDSNSALGNSGGGFSILNGAGSGNLLRGNTAQANTGDGFLVQTNTNTLSGNTANLSSSAGFRLNSLSNTSRAIGNISHANSDDGFALENSSDGYFLQNSSDSNGGWAFDVDALSLTNVFVKNNVIPGGVFPDSGVRNAIAATTLNFSRSWWGTIDSAAISGKSRITALGAVTSDPFRLGIIDTGFGADTIAPKAPDTVATINFSNTTVIVTWARSDTNEESQRDTALSAHRIYRSLTKDTSLWQFVGQSYVPVDTFVDSGLTTATDYYYRVTAIDTNEPFVNESFLSDSIILGTTGELIKPESFTLVNPAANVETTATTITFRWTDSRDSTPPILYQLIIDTDFAGAFVFDSVVSGTAVAVTLGANDTYQWRVIASDALGNTTAIGDSQFAIDTAPPTPAVLLAPPGGIETNVATISFTWQASADSLSGLQKHQIQVDRFGIFSLLIIDSSVGTGTDTTFIFAANETYFWRIVSHDDVGNTVTSASRSFVIDTLPPTIVATANPISGTETTATGITFSWELSNDSIAGLANYRLQVDTRTGFLNSLVDSLTSTNVEGSAILIANDSYQWRVIATDNAGNTSVSSATLLMLDQRANTVVLANPADGKFLNDSTPVLAWDALADSSGVDSYAIQVSTDSAFAALVFSDTSDGAETAVTLGVLQQDSYFWRVQAIDSLGNIGAFSTGREFLIDTHVDTVAITSPVSGASVSHTLVIIWDTVNDSSSIDSFVIHISTTETFASLASQDTVDGSETSLTKQNLFADTYYARVITIDGAGNVNASAAPVSLVIIDTTVSLFLVQPDTIADTNAAPAVFEWSTIDNPETYTWVLANDSDFTSVADSAFEINDTLILRTLPRQDTFYWRVIGRDRAGNVDTTPGRLILLDTFVDTVSQSAPAHAIETNVIPALSWNLIPSDSTGIDSFYVEVARTPAFSLTVFADTRDGTETSVTPTGTQNDTFYWRVRAIDGAGNISLSPDSRRFLHDSFVRKVTLLSPLNTSKTNDTTPTLSWNAVPDSVGIDSYVIEVTDTATFANIVFSDTVDGTVTSDTVTTNLTQDTYYWRVRAIDELGNLGEYSDSFQFEIDTGLIVFLDQPAANHETRLATVTFSWTATSADTFTWQLSETSGFTGLTDSVAITTGTSVTRTLPFEDTFYWRVAGYDNAGNFDTSLPRLILLDSTVETVTLASPANGARSGDSTPTFSWNAIADSVGIDSYVLEVTRSDTFGYITFTDTLAGSLTDDTVTAGLQADTYYWRVRAIDEIGNVSANSDFRIIIIDTQVSISLDTPADNHETNVNPVTYAWISPDGDTFTWQISDTSSFASISDSVVDTVVRSLIKPFTDQDTFYWRVIAKDQFGNIDTTAARTILFDSSTDTVILATPAADTIFRDSTPSFDWNAVADSVGIDSYVLEISTSSSFTSISFADTVDGSFTGDTLASPLQADTYFWRVRAIDDLGNAGPNSDSRRFTIDTLVGVSLLAPAAGIETNIAAQSFSWSGTGAETFTWHLSRSSVFASFVDSAPDTIVTAVASTLSVEDTHYWRVIARDRSGNFETTPTRILLLDQTVESIAIISPDTGAAIANTLIVFWNIPADSSGIESFVVEISRFDSFVPIFSSDTLAGTETSYTRSDLFQDTYFIQVKAIDGAGNRGPDSPVSVIIIDTITDVDHVSPEDGSETQDSPITFIWITTDNAETYTWQLSRDTNFTTIVDSLVATGNTNVARAMPDQDTFYWRVLARDRAGNFDTTSGRALLYDSSVQKVTLAAPVDSIETNLVPDLAWNLIAADSSGIDSYVLEVSRRSSFDSILYTRTLDSAASADSAPNAINDTFFWRVRAIDGAKNIGPYSDSRQFLHDSIVSQITLASPDDRHETTNASFSLVWNAIADSSGVDSYILEIAADAAFTMIVRADTLGETVTSATVSSLGNDSFYWRVRAVDELGNIGQNSIARSFAIDNSAPDTFQRITPSSGFETSGTTIAFTWTASSDSGTGIDSYRLQISLVSTFASTVVDTELDSSATSSTVTIAGSDTYYWRVIAIDLVGNTSAAIPTSDSSFIIDTITPAPFTLISPIGHDTTASPVFFDWTASSDTHSGLAGYRLEVSLDPLFGSHVIDSSQSSPDTSHALTSALYYWRVTAVDDAGNTAATSVDSFVVPDTAGPTIIYFTSLPDTLATTAGTTLVIGKIVDSETPATVTIKRIGPTSIGDSILVVGNDGTFSGVFVLETPRDIATTTFELNATDRGGNASRDSFGLTVVKLVMVVPDSLGIRSETIILPTAGNTAIAAKFDTSYRMALKIVPTMPSSETIDFRLDLDSSSFTGGFAVFSRPEPNALFSETTLEYGRLPLSNALMRKYLLEVLVYDSKGLPVYSSTQPYSTETSVEKPIRLVFHYDHEDFGDFENLLRIHYWDGNAGKWRMAKDSSLLWVKDLGASMDNDTIGAVVRHLTIFAPLPVPGVGINFTGAIEVFPNPFIPYDGNPLTGLPFSGAQTTQNATGIHIINTPSPVTITFYDIRGRKIDRIDNLTNSGMVIWDARNDKNEDVASGVYLVVIEGGGQRIVKKLAIVR